MRKSILVIALLAMFALAACGGGKETPAAANAPSAQEAIAQVLKVTAHDIYFNEPDNLANPPVWNVNAGEAFEVDLDNQGALQHNWAIVKQGSEVPIPFVIETNSDLLLEDAGVVEPGKSEAVQLTVAEPGTYTIICTVAGHYPSMQGKLIVQ